MIIVLWGVSGCGKSTVGQILATRLGCNFYDADDFHPASNVEKMRAGVALTDEDRWPWLDELARVLRTTLERNESAVLACSALRQVYRDRLTVDRDRVIFVQLKGSFELIESRLASREHEFMSSSLLRSQFDTLESPQEGLFVDIRDQPEQICTQVEKMLGIG